MNKASLVGWLVAAGVLVIFCAGGYYLLRQVLWSFGIPYSSYWVANYDGYSFSMHGDRVDCVWTHPFPDDPDSPQLFLRVANRDDLGVFHVRRFPESLAQEILPFKIEDAVVPDYENKCTEYAYRGAVYEVDRICYDHGEVVAAFLYGSQFQVSPSPQGPFLELPTTRQKLLEVFGKPRKWVRVRKFGP